MSGYVELHARSAFSFLRGASSPEQLAERAAELGLPAIALCDRDGVYGAPRLFAAAKEHGIRAIVGAELTMENDTVLPVLVENRTGYRNLCRLITRTQVIALEDAPSPLVQMDAGERLQADYDGMNLTTGPHAMALLRPHLPEDVWSAADLLDAQDGQSVRIAGNVICRQRPGTAKGFVFISLEDETGIANAIVNPTLFERQRLTLSQEAFLLIEGRVQITEGTIHVKAVRVEGLRHRDSAHAQSHDFH